MSIEEGHIDCLAGKEPDNFDLGVCVAFGRRGWRAALLKRKVRIDELRILSLPGFVCSLDSIASSSCIVSFSLESSSTRVSGLDMYFSLLANENSLVKPCSNVIHTAVAVRLIAIALPLSVYVHVVYPAVKAAEHVVDRDLVSSVCEVSNPVVVALRGWIGHRSWRLFNGRGHAR